MPWPSRLWIFSQSSTYIPRGCVLNMKAQLLWLEIKFCSTCFLACSRCEVWFNCIIKPQVTRKRGYRKLLAGWILCDSKCLLSAESGLTSTVYFVPSGSHLYLGMRRRFVLNESLHSRPRFLGRVVFKQSSNSAVLRLSIKNTLDISPSPGGVCLWFSLAPLRTLSTHLVFTGAMVLSRCRSNAAMRYPSAGFLFWWKQFRRV